MNKILKKIIDNNEFLILLVLIIGILNTIYIFYLFSTFIKWNANGFFYRTTLVIMAIDYIFLIFLKSNPSNNE